MKFAYSNGDRFTVNLPSSEHHGKSGVVIDHIPGISGCQVVQLDGPAKEKTTFFYRYLTKMNPRQD